MKKLSVSLFDTNAEQEPIDIYNNILSIYFGALDRGDLSNTVEWGIYSNIGELKLIDNNREIFNLVNSGLEIKAHIYASNDRFHTLVGTFIVDNPIYNRETQEITLDLKDSLLNWQNISVPKIYLFDSTDIYTLLNEILSHTSVNIKYFDDITEDFLTETEIYCPYLESSSLWDMITQICEIAMCRVYEDKNGEATIVYVGSTVKNQNSPIIVRSKNIFGISNIVPKVKTAIPSANILSTPRERKYSTVAKASYTLYIADTQNLPTASDGTVLPENFPHKFVGNVSSYNPDTVMKTFDSTFGYTGITIERSYVTPTVQASSIFAIDKLNVDAAVTRSSKVTGNAYLSPNNQYTTFATYYDEPITVVDDYSFITRSNEIALVFSMPYISVWSGSYPDMVYSNVNVKITGKYFVDYDLLANSYGEGDKIELPTNKLLQTNNEYKNQSHAQYILDTVQRLYSKGIECCTMECSFGDYYDENNNIIYNGNDFNSAINSFKKYDVVMPYIMLNGVEQPYAIKADGTPKKFIIIGIKYYYTGNLKQELYLQEVSENF